MLTVSLDDWFILGCAWRANYFAVASSIFFLMSKHEFSSTPLNTRGSMRVRFELNKALVTCGWAGVVM